MIDTVITFAFAILIIATLAGLYRLSVGPGLLNRVLAFDLITTCVVGMIVLQSMLWKTVYFLELILIFSLLGFLSTVAFVFFLQNSISSRQKFDGSDQSEFDPESTWAP